MSTTTNITQRSLEPIGKNLVGIIGGSGINDSPLFNNAAWYEFNTNYTNKYGDGRVYAQIDESKGVVFIPRHGIPEVCRFGPSNTQYAANIIALERLGVTCVIAVSACGSLHNTINVASLVVPDDYIDETNRNDNLFEEGLVVHANPIPPFSQGLRKILITSANVWEKQGKYMSCYSTFFDGVHTQGTYVAIPGDRFGTKAEGLRRAQYASVVGMTICPEASMALQAGLHYAVAAIPVDANLDANHESQTLAVMKELSSPEKLPAYISRVVEQTKEFAKTAGPISQLKGNIIPGNLCNIKNDCLHQIAKKLISIYCQKTDANLSTHIHNILDEDHEDQLEPALEI
ncbi:MAG: MTAP family purine nucleoside phosphorylase [Nanoarchaeota archaeon]